MSALYLTAWLALLLFVVGQTGRSFTPHGRPPPQWAWWSFTTGLLLAVFHTVVSFAVVHDWSHAHAVRSTALQTQEVYGIDAGWGVYVNYVFLAVWLADAWWWRADPARPPRW